MAAITAYPASSLSQMPRLLTKATSFLLVQLSVNLSLAAVVVLLVSVLSLDQYATQPTIAHPHVPGIIMLSVSCTLGLLVCRTISYCSCFTKPTVFGRHIWARCIARAVQ